MTATEERNKPVDGRDVARRLRETGALDGLFEQIDSGEARDDRGPGAAPRSAPRRFRGRGLRAEPAEHPGPWSKGSRRHRPAASALGRDHDQDHRLRGGPLRDQWCPGVRAGSLDAAPGSAMGQRRMDGLDSMIIGLYAGGMTAREIRHHSGVHHRRGS